MRYDIDLECFRDFDGLTPIEGAVEEWETPNDWGYSEHWFTRLVFEDGYKAESPIIEFYSSARIDQFVSAYYCDTFVNGYYGGGWGSGMDLQGDVASWKIEADYADEIRQWVVDTLDELGIEM